MNISQAKQIPLEAVLDHWGAIPTKETGKEIWYISPFREEKTASFHINSDRQIWHDFGIGKGGTIIDLVLVWLETNGHVTSISDALKWLDTHFPHGQYKVRVKPILAPLPDELITEKERRTIYHFIESRSLSHPKLLNYLQSRAINLDIAVKYLEQAHIWHRGKQKEYYGLAFPNDMKGFEFRNLYMKSSFGTKAITTLKAANDNVTHVFEGFMDFLSVLTMDETDQHRSTVIVLNSLSFHPQLLHDLDAYEGAIHSWYDNDTAGENMTKLLDVWAQSHDQIEHKPMNHLYEGHKDVNDWWMHCTMS